MHKVMIEGMSCSHCVKRVEDALKAIPGICDVSVSLDENAAYFSGDIDHTVISEAIDNAGYDVTEISR